MKIRNRLSILKEKLYTAPTEQSNTRYDYHTLQNYPFGIAEQYEFLTEHDMKRIKEKIASLNESTVGSPL